MPNDSIVMKFVKRDVLRISMTQDASEMTVRFRGNAQSTFNRMRQLATVNKDAVVETHQDDLGLTIRGWAVKPVYDAWFQAGYLAGSKDPFECLRMEAAMSGQILESDGKVLIGSTNVLVL